jgi:hypothetical protein
VTHRLVIALAILPFAATLLSCAAKSPRYERSQVADLVRAVPGKIGFVNIAEGATPAQTDAILLAVNSVEQSSAIVTPHSNDKSCDVTYVLHQSQPSDKPIQCANVRTFLQSIVKLPSASRVVVLDRAATSRQGERVYARLKPDYPNVMLIATETNLFKLDISAADLEELEKAVGSDR